MTDARTELETTTDDADNLTCHDGFPQPGSRPTDPALVAVHAVHPDANARYARTQTHADAGAGTQRVAVQHARRGSGGEKFWTPRTVSTDAV